MINLDVHPQVSTPINPQHVKLSSFCNTIYKLFKAIGELLHICFTPRQERGLESLDRAEVLEPFLKSESISGALKVSKLRTNSIIREKVKTVAKAWYDYLNAVEIRTPSEDTHRNMSWHLHRNKARELHRSDIYVCRDQLHNSVQALAFTTNERISGHKADYMNLDGILTNPMNIRDSSRGQQPIVRGAGTAVISTLAKRCLEEGLEGIYASADQSAVDFYKKLGFKILGWEESKPYRHGFFDMGTPMLLSGPGLEALNARK